MADTTSGMTALMGAMLGTVITQTVTVLLARRKSPGALSLLAAKVTIRIDRQGANLFFQLVSRRYERGAILLPSNQSLGAWGEVFGDAVIAGAIIDRLLHHATTVNIKGDSYRLRDKRKAGLVRSTLMAPSEP